MSYDLMVFDPSAAPQERDAFLAWYDVQAQWSEGHPYNDPVVTSAPLQRWFHEMREHFPAMNGPYRSASEDVHVTDYCIGRSVIYVTFAWSLAEEAYTRTRSVASKHGVGFYDVSGETGDVVYPDSATTSEH